MSAALNSFAPSIAHPRTIATPVTDCRVLPFGVDQIDSRLGAGAYALVRSTRRLRKTCEPVLTDPGPLIQSDVMEA